MAFMQHVATYGTFHQLDTRNEGIVSYPGEYFFPAEVAKMHDADVEDVETVIGWFARLSAPGYMDCTEWQGPYETEAEALADLAETFGDDDEEDDNEV